MFTGEFTHSLDLKGRVSVPAEIREVLRIQYDERLVITKSLEGTCLWAFPYGEWDRLAERIAEKGVGGRQLIRLRRRFFAPARTCPLDKAGRILVPEPLREHAVLDKEITFASMGGYIELWSPSLWQAEVESLDEGADALLEAMVELGL
jgi:MraZ protein